MATFFLFIYASIKVLVQRYSINSKLSSPAFVSRYVSVIHTFVLVGLTCAYFLEYLSDELWTYLQIIPFGYCIYDLQLIIAKRHDAGMFNVTTFVHHIIFMLCIIFAFPKFPLHVSLAYLSEVSNPFLYTCYFLHKTNKINTTLFRISAYLLVITFFAFRVVLFTILLFLSFYITDQISVRIFTGILTAINWYWFSRLMTKLK